MGTTSTPKLVAHTLQSLTRPTKRDLSRGAELRWGLLYDLTRFAGLQVYLQALAGGSLLLLPTAGALVPQHMETDMSAGLDADQLASIRRRSPLGRLAETRDVAHMTAFLMSDEAPAITGASLTVDAGSTA